MAVFVLDKHKKPPVPCREKRARALRTRSRAVVVRRYPFTIRLNDRAGGEVQPLWGKLDPSSKITGIAAVTDEDVNKPVLCRFELSHCGRQISEALRARRAFRRRRRSANLRDRAPPFDHRIPPEGSLPPRVAVRATGSFNVGKADGINAKYRKLFHRPDGDGHAWRPRACAPCLKAEDSTRGFR